MAFSNASIHAPRYGKPHVCKREGWWRVSPIDRRHVKSVSAIMIWNRAHNFVYAANVAERNEYMRRKAQ